MANEITVTGTLSINDGGVTVTGSKTNTLSLNTAGQKHEDIQGLTTSLADIALGATITWSTVGLLWLKNASITPGEDITITKSAIEMGVLKPGESLGPWRPKADGTAMRAKSATGTPSLSIVCTGATT